MTFTASNLLIIGVSQSMIVIYGILSFLFIAFKELEVSLNLFQTSNHIYQASLKQFNKYHQN